ncbi:MAG: TIGR04282 family arsenosugar biosynthesis glycosyltransferase [Novosphingobium sp.]|nr:TIGR04282 family arsenosugar biosynthesis glycosyltransferase [Novosphingobium sp.]
MPQPRLTIFARFPEAGKAKTRLIPALGPDGAARLYARLLENTLANATKSGLEIELRVTGGSREAFVALCGDGHEIAQQGGGDLGERLARVPAPAIIIGSDAPALDDKMLRQARVALESHEAVIGPASDGGYYLIGFTRPIPFAFSAMAWSTPEVLPETLRRLEANGIEPALLPVLGDIDRPEDLAQWPELLE